MRDAGSRFGGTRFDDEVESGLRRLFEPPRELDRVLERTLQRQRAGARRRGLRRVGPVFVLLGAAAAVVALAALSGLFERTSFERTSATVARAPRLPSKLSEFPPLAECLPAVGPLEEVRLDPSSKLEPDLERIYREVAECDQASAPNQMACGAEDRLDRKLAATYGEDFRLKPSAAGMLHGPYASKEWPTCMVLAGFPEATTAVLVAERDATLSCCVSPQLAPESGLNSFTWRFGDLVVTEITPLEEPQLLDYFESE